MTNEEKIDKKLLIQGTLQDVVADFLFYDRKEDEELPAGSIQKAIAAGVTSIEEMARIVEGALRESLAPTARR